MDIIDALLAETSAAVRGVGRPWVSLCYAQSLDGSLTARPGESTALSGPESNKLTHGLRATHDAILVGVGTVLADDPRLTVRLVEGRNPQPVILDSRLRTPPQAYLVQAHPLRAWIATTQEGMARSNDVLASLAGVRMLALPVDSRGRVSLPALLDRLGELGIRRLMVEGGARVLTSFLSQRLADQVILTIAPCFTGGLHIADSYPEDRQDGLGLGLLRLESVQYQRLGDDLIVWGRF